jgi:hypothetical protein
LPVGFSENSRTAVVATPVAPDAGVSDVTDGADAVANVQLDVGAITLPDASTGLDAKGIAAS